MGAPGVEAIERHLLREHPDVLPPSKKHVDYGELLGRMRLKMND